MSVHNVKEIKGLRLTTFSSGAFVLQGGDLPRIKLDLTVDELLVLDPVFREGFIIHILID
jgi:hypothetical protein